MTTWIISVYATCTGCCMHMSILTGATTGENRDDSNVFNNSFSEARLHAGRYKSSLALRQPGCVGKCFCSNYSLVREKEGEEKRATEMKSEKVTSAL